MAAVDILYIDITRRWNSVTLDQRESGTRWLPSHPMVPLPDRRGERSAPLLSFHIVEGRGKVNGVEFKA